MEISAQELRIGNWVEFGRKENGDFLIGQVEGLYGDLMGGTVNIKNHDQTFLAQQLFPIPLTKEWLLKFGFDFLTDIGVFKLKFTISSQVGDFEFAGVPKAIGFISNGLFASGHIQYVHQLQNLFFALTCEELTIKQPIENSFWDKLPDAIDGFTEVFGKK